MPEIPLRQTGFTSNTRDHLLKTIIYEKILRDKAFNIAQNPKL